MPEDTIDRALGRVEGKLDSALGRFDDVFTRLDKLDATAAEAKAAATAANEWIGNTKPFVANLSKWQQRGIGIWIATMAISTSVGLLVGTFKTQVFKLLGITA